jgi:hypothetical protein
MGRGHIDGELCSGLVHLFEVANGQESASALDAAVASLADSCSASESVLQRLRTAALETHVDADRRRRHETELRALLRVAQQLLASASLSDSMDSLVSATRQLLSADVAHINLHADDGRYDSARAIQGEMTEAFRRQKTPPGAGLTGLVTETKSPYIAIDYLSDPRIRHSPTGDASVRSDGLRTLVGVPVMHRDDVIAVLIVSYRATTAISDEQLGLLVSLATLAGLTMEQASRRDHEKEVFRKIHDDSTLLKAENAQLAWAAACYADLMELVLLGRGIEDLVAAVSNAFHCAAGVLDADGVLIASAQDANGAALSLPDGIVGHLGSDAYEDARILNISDEKNPMWLCPVRYREEVLGATFVCRETLDDVEQMTLARIGQLVAQSLRDSKYGTGSGELDRQTIASLLDGRSQDDYTADLSHALGSSAKKTLITLVAIGDPTQQLRMHHFGVRIARESSGVAGSQDGRLVIIIPGTDASSAAETVASRLTSSLGSPVWVGAARSDSPRGLSLAAAEALRCARCLQRMGRGGGSATVQTLGQIGLLLGSESEDTVGEFIHTSIGPLLEYDNARRSELVRTLEAYLSHNSSLKAAASELHVHPNTVLQRVQKISVLLGEDDWRSRSEKRLDLQLALRLHGLSQAPH